MCVAFLMEVSLSGRPIGTLQEWNGDSTSLSSVDNLSVTPEARLFLGHTGGWRGLQS